LLDRVEAQLQEMGRAIFSGAAQVDPYRKSRERRVNFAIIAPCAGLIRGRTGIVCCVRRRRKPSITQAFHNADKAPPLPVTKPDSAARSNVVVHIVIGAQKFMGKSRGQFVCW